MFFPQKKFFSIKNFFSEKKFFRKKLSKKFFVSNSHAKLHASAIVYIYHAHCIPFNKIKKIDKKRIKQSFLNTAHSAVVEDFPPTCHVSSFLKGLSSVRKLNNWITPKV